VLREGMMMMGGSRSWFCMVMTVLSLGACEGGPTIPEGKTPELLGETGIVPPDGLSPGDLDDDLAQHTEGVAGFAGLVRQSDGSLGVRFTAVSNDRNLEKVRSAVLNSVAFAERAEGRRFSGKLDTATHTFSELVAIRALVRSRVLPTVDAVNLLYIDERRNRLIIGIAPGDSEVEVLRALSDAQIPSTAFQLIRAKTARPVANLTDTFSPVPGGVAIGSPCTLAANVDRFGTTAALTAAHCFLNGFGGGSATMRQPWVGGRTIGSGKVAESDISTGSSCPSGMSKCTFTDAVLVEYDHADTAQFGKIAKSHLHDESDESIDLTVSGRYTITGKGSVMADDTVQYTGSRTGAWEARVWDTCADRKIDYSDLGLGDIWLRCQLFLRTGVLPEGGDSGGPVYTTSSFSNDVALVGMLVANDTIIVDGKDFPMGVANHLLYIESDLGGPLVVN